MQYASPISKPHKRPTTILLTSHATLATAWFLLALAALALFAAVAALAGRWWRHAAWPTEG